MNLLNYNVVLDIIQIFFSYTVMQKNLDRKKHALWKQNSRDSGHGVGRTSKTKKKKGREHEGGEEDDGTSESEIFEMAVKNTNKRHPGGSKGLTADDRNQWKEF